MDKQLLLRGSRETYAHEAGLNQCDPSPEERGTRVSKGDGYRPALFSIRTDRALLDGDWSASRRAGSTRHDELVQFLIDDLDRTVDFGVGYAKLMRNELHQQVDAFDGRRATGDRPGRRRGPEKAFRRFGVFLERYLIRGIGAQTLGDGIDMVIDRLREADIAVHRVADRLRLLRRDAAVIPGQQHRPFGQGYEHRIEHFELHRHVLAIQLHRIDVGFQLPKQQVMFLVRK